MGVAIHSDKTSFVLRRLQGRIAALVNDAPSTGAGDDRTYLDDVDYYLFEVIARIPFDIESVTPDDVLLSRYIGDMGARIQSLIKAAQMCAEVKCGRIFDHILFTLDAYRGGIFYDSFASECAEVATGSGSEEYAVKFLRRITNPNLRRNSVMQQSMRFTSRLGGIG